MADVTLRLAAAGGQATKREVDAVRESARRLGYDVHAGAQQATGALGSAGAGIERLAKQGQQLASISPVLGGLVSHVGALGSSMGDAAHLSAFLGGSLKDQLAFGANAAGAGLVAGAVAGVREFLSEASAIREFQRASGAAAPDASKLVFVSHELGLESSNVARGVLLLSQSMRGANSPLAQYGINIARNKAGSADLVGTLLNVAGAYEHLAPGVERNNLLVDIFGKRFGLQLAPLLGRGKEGIKELADEAERMGLVFSQGQLDQAKELSLSMRELESAGKGLAISLGSGLVPAVTDAVHVFTPLIEVLTHTHILTTALEAFIGVKLYRAFLSAVSGIRAWVTSLFTATAAEGAAAAGAGELATATAAAGTTGAAGMGRLAGAVKFISFAAPIAGLEILNIRLNASQQSASDLANRIKAAAGPDITAQIKALSGELERQQKIAGRGVNIGKVVFSDERAAHANDRVKELKRQIADLEAQLVGMGKDGSQALEDIGTAAETAGQKWDKAFTHLDAVRDSASATRSYADEVRKLRDIQKPENSGEVEHAKRVEAATRARQDAARATRATTEAERQYNEVARENVAQLQRQADEQARLADVTVRTSARDAAKAAAHVTALQRAGIGGQTLAAAQDEAERLGIAADQAKDDAAKAHETAAGVGADHDRRLAAATDAVTQAKNAEKDAVDKVAKATSDARVPAAQLGTTTAELADQIDRVVAAAKTDWGDRLKAGLVTPDQAAQGLVGTLTSLRALVTDPVLRAELDKIIGGAVTSTAETAAPGGPVHSVGSQGPGARPNASGGVFPFITAGPTLLGERQTGGEAFIPRLGVSHRAALGYADAAARWHGGRVVTMAEGGVYGGDGMVRPWGGTTVVRETVKVITIPQQLVGTLMDVREQHVATDDFKGFKRQMQTEGVIPKFKAAG